MAIDISTDLNIFLLAQNISTPTITGVYDTGSPPGTYLPGKDFSPADNVSTGKLAQLNLSIAFDSVSHEVYVLDRVFIQSVDDPREDGLGRVPGRWINTDPDPTDITDDGLNLIIPNYDANMSSIVFGPGANILSNSTVTTGISLTLPAFGFWWKSKLMTNIRVVAEKDGIRKVSEPLLMPTILLSTAGNLNSALASGGNITYNQAGAGGPGFTVPLTITTNKENLPNISNINDIPDFDLITYKINYAVSVNGTGVPLTIPQFSVSPIGFAELVSASYASGVLEVTLRQTQPGFVGAVINSFVPYNAAGTETATVGVSATWAAVPPEVSGFVNGYLFTKTASGSASRTVIVDVSGQPPSPVPRIQESINGALSNGIVGQSLFLQHYGCFRTAGSVIIRMIDSPLASFGPGLTPSYYFTDTGGILVSGPIPPDGYTALYGHYDFPASYNPNSVAEAVISGVIPVTTYAELVAEGKIPNILMFTITKDLFAGHTVDPSKGMEFQFTGNMNVINQAEFAALYDSDPRNSYPTYLYSYMSLATCYASAAEGYAAVGQYLAAIDSLTRRGSAVFLNLGTTAKDQPISVQRFGAASYVRALLPFDALTSYIEYAVTGDYDSTLSTITDYSRSYCLTVRWTVVSGASAFATIPSGTVLTVTLPPQLAPYVYIAGTPAVRVLIGGTVFEIPITDYDLDEGQLTLVMPVEVDMRPDSVCVPIRFFIPSTDLATSFSSLTFSEPLVYTEDPSSLIYGFTTDSLMFRVVTVPRAFTLKGAQIDTTGLTVFPTVYERGQMVVYTATVYNRSYSPSSDYCMAITVPTNEYNPAETSNNSLPAYIRDINPLNPATTVYFQTAANATAEDIYIMKTINRPGGPTLKEYYDSVIVNRWTLYTGQTLPWDVVMLVGCTPGIALGESVRIDYEVLIEVPPGDNTLYTNDAVFNYYSSGANLESQSNLTTVRNRTAEPIPVTKAPATQFRELKNGVSVPFDAYFNAPTDYLIFKSFTLTDVLHPGVMLDVANCSVLKYPGAPVDFTLGYDPVTNTAVFEMENSAAVAGGLIMVHIAATVTDTTLIPFDPVYQTIGFRNTVELTVNHDPALASLSNEVVVLFSLPEPAPVPITKAPQSQRRPKINGTAVVFDLTFTAPAETRVYQSFTITDIFHPALSADLLNIRVTAAPGDVNVPFNFVYNHVSGELSVSFLNTDLTAGRLITVSLAAVVGDVTLIPPGNIIENTARLTINNNPLIYSDSNTVTVLFASLLPCQAVTDLIVSVALEEAALSHILNAEGEKLQLGILIAQTPEELLSLNASVDSMLAAVSRLEAILLKKLEAVDCDICGEC